MTANEAYGGLAMGYQAHCIVMEELSRASGSIGFELCGAQPALREPIVSEWE